MLPGIGIFGHGPLAGLVIAFLRKNGFKIEAIWSPNESLATAAGHQFRVPFSSPVIDQVLLRPSVHLIVIICPPHYHSQIASKACGIGKHVVCGWPPAYTIQEMRSMHLAASNYPSLITLIVTALRFVPAFAVMRKLIVEDQLIGKIKIINGSVCCDVLALHEQSSNNSDKHMGGGLLSLYGINLIDVITFTTGLRARRVHATIRSNLSQFPTGDQHNNHVITRNSDDFVSFQMEMCRPSASPPLVPVRMNGTRKPKASSLSSNSSTSSFSSLNQDQSFEYGSSVIANVVLNGLHCNQSPVTELTVYGTNGYLVCRDGNLYGRLRQPQSSQQSQSSPQRSSSPKLNTLYLDDYDMEELIGPNLDSSSNGHYPQHQHQHHLPSSPDPSSIESLLLQTGPVWPPLYQHGIYRMIVALKQAFFGTKSQQQQQGHSLRNSSNNNNNNNNIEKKPNNANNVIVDHRNSANNHNAHHHHHQDTNNGTINGDETGSLSSWSSSMDNGRTNPYPSISIEEDDDDELSSSNNFIEPEISSLPPPPQSPVVVDDLKQREDTEIHWAKEPVNDAANFEEALYLQTVMDSIKESADTNQWIRIRYQ